MAPNKIPPKILFAHHPRLVKQKIDFRLRVLGYDVEITQYGFQALQMMEKVKFDLILIDDILLDMSGYELLLVLRGQWSEKEMPVIIFTTEKDEGELIRIMSAGANHYLEKSQNINSLINLLKQELKA